MDAKKPMHPPKLEEQILMFLAHQNGKWCTYGTGFYMPSVQQVFPIGTSRAKQLKFMQAMQKNGLVGGCDCGCRGDYTVTELGLIVLADSSSCGEQEAKRYLDGDFSFGY